MDIDFLKPVFPLKKKYGLMLKQLKKMKKLLLLILTIVFLNACEISKKDGFVQIPPSQSHLDFENTITESDTFNILTNEFIYNGAGVAIGDLNGDGWDDLFFAGNQVDNRLYLNQQELKFKDITEQAGIEKPNKNYWSSGVNLVDLNLDGKLDIYICNTLHADSLLRKNWLFVNQGNNEDGIPSFIEMAEAYGIADDSHSSHAQFFDYDNDGDLDLFIGTNQIIEEVPNDFQEKKNDGTSPTRDNLFQNNWNEALGHPVYTDVSLEAGILQDGYSHSTLINDFNNDGWLDIYVANDFQSDDLVFINQQDGTFKDAASSTLKHFSLSAMGSDLADVNNDGELDFYVTEMQPYYNKRKKLFQGPSNYQRQKLTERYGYHYQYPRNTLQLNRGVAPNSELPVFSDVGLYAKVQETDWSWAPLFADYDNDGFQDLFITNGFPKDVTDHDFSDFRNIASRLVDIQTLLSAIPAVKVPNFVFRNKGDLEFENVTKDWNLGVPSFSNGAAYGDLDKDGDLDLVVSNIDDPTFLLENNIPQEENHYLRIKLNGSEQNPLAYGTAVSVFAEGHQQKLMLLSGRGYLSTSEQMLHFGLGNSSEIDSVHIIWPGGKVQKMGSISTDQVLEISYNPNQTQETRANSNDEKALFDEVAKDYQLDFLHQEFDYVDFNIQRTIPHKFSQYGPAMAVADVNNDGLEDLLLGGSFKLNQHWFIQQADGQFTKKEVNYKTDTKEGKDEDAGLLLFDADGDGFKDLYMAKGGSQYLPKDTLYKDMFLLNDGMGNFTYVKNALPDLPVNSSAVKGADYDQDGDIDLFIGSRVLPLYYPKADYSYILRNDSEPGAPKFTDVTKDVIPELGEKSMISDAIWTDFNNDFWPDLILMCEWSAIRIFENQQGKLVEVTDASGLADYKGWWTSIAAADFDNDGDMDYVAGNFGENLFFQCSGEEPLRIYAKDLDNNGSIDPLISCYWPDSLGNRHEYFYHPLQDVIKQFVGIRKTISTFGQYGEATVADIFTEEDKKDALILETNWMKTSWLENVGDGKFEVHALPTPAQFAPVYGILPYDFNQDSYLDILIVGNDHGMEVQQGRADAFIGLALQNDGKGNFSPLTVKESQFFVPGDGKSLALINLSNQAPIALAGQNLGALKAFKLTEAGIQSIIPISDQTVKTKIELTDGSYRFQEFYFGNTFYSQSGRFVLVKEGEKVTQFNHSGEEISLTQ